MFNRVLQKITKFNVKNTENQNIKQLKGKVKNIIKNLKNQDGSQAEGSRRTLKNRQRRNVNYLSTKEKKDTSTINGNELKKVTSEEENRRHKLKWNTQEIEEEEMKIHPFLNISDSKLYNYPTMRDESKIKHRMAYLKRQASFIDHILSLQTKVLEVRSLVTAPIPKSCGNMQLFIRRYNSGFNKVYPKYVLCVRIINDESGIEGRE